MLLDVLRREFDLTSVRRTCGSGTAAGGSSLELDRWLKAGDIVELEIEGIGVLRNRAGEKASQPRAVVEARR